MNRIYLVLCYLLLLMTCNAQEKVQQQIVGGPCEGCEAVFEYGNRSLYSSDTLPDFEYTNPKLKLHGTVFQHDGKTPAANVLIYVYHTNQDGLYKAKENATGWGKTHGYLRGWVRTDQFGQYTFYTFRPAAYPSGTDPEHIHMTVKESTRNEYYIDSVVFDDDKLLSKKERSLLPNRGGSGIVQPVLQKGIYHIKRDIILGLNIPAY